MALALLAFWLYRRRFAAAAPGGRRAEHGETKEETATRAAGSGIESPYEVLGITTDADDEAVKRAYREMIGKYHPDRVQHLGREFQEMAAKKTVVITAAYEKITAERGLS